ncbi:hypothetical protein PUNSTDRAFT_144542 [Punctularia strigosozonata HHB-11173 SS5]|uniref:uncharacterized protein n=1 Tax=Punctularia strigosozonata (strain HHB-11173) TaxID=741275 RepID=UPI00044180BA|nr:uncharacterized protein PUNSTDRAFT_144542 [Punctularia strigosozonata HHB-11173 SS5]EIN08119.1 hypothetical protein PUNSTDRAFT_144542 [Punctularia strigosozonata HHB-11173 SS5]
MSLSPTEGSNSTAVTSTSSVSSFSTASLSSSMSMSSSSSNSSSALHSSASSSPSSMPDPTTLSSISDDPPPSSTIDSSQASDPTSSASDPTSSTTTETTSSTSVSTGPSGTATGPTNTDTNTATNTNTDTLTTPTDTATTSTTGTDTGTATFTGSGPTSSTSGVTSAPSTSSSSLVVSSQTSVSTTVFVTTNAQGRATTVTEQSTQIVLSTQTASSSNNSGGSSDTGAIVGGVVGGVAAILLALLLLWWLRRRRSKDNFDGNFDPDRVVRHSGGANLDLGEAAQVEPYTLGVGGNTNTSPSATSAGFAGMGAGAGAEMTQYGDQRTSLAHSHSMTSASHSGSGPSQGYAPAAAAGYYGGSSTSQSGSHPMSAKEREAQRLRVANDTSGQSAGGPSGVYVHSDGGRIPEEVEQSPPNEIPPTHHSDSPSPSIHDTLPGVVQFHVDIDRRAVVFYHDERDHVYNGHFIYFDFYHGYHQLDVNLHLDLRHVHVYFVNDLHIQYHVDDINVHNIVEHHQHHQLVHYNGVAVTITVVTQTTPSSSATSAVARKSTTFFHNTGAVAGTFSAVGVIALVIFAYIVTMAIRRRRARRFDEEVDEAARRAYQEAEATKANIDYRYMDDDDAYPHGGVGAGGRMYGGDEPYNQFGSGYGTSSYGTSGDKHDAFSHTTDTTHGTMAQPPMMADHYVPPVPVMGGYESYGMQDLNHAPGVYNTGAPAFDPYAAASMDLSAVPPGPGGAAGIGAGAAAVARQKSMREQGRQSVQPHHAFAGPTMPSPFTDASHELLMAAGLADSSSAAATSLARNPSQQLLRSKSSKSNPLSTSTSGASDEDGVYRNVNRTPSNPGLLRQKSTTTMLPSYSESVPPPQNARSRRSSNPLQPQPSDASPPPQPQESYASHYASDSQHPAAGSGKPRSRPNSLVLDTALAAPTKRNSQLMPDSGNPYGGYATPTPLPREHTQNSSPSPRSSDDDANSPRGLDPPTPGYADGDPSRLSLQDADDYGFGGGKRVLRVANE